jgi:hypothetical protein
MKKLFLLFLIMPVLAEAQSNMTISNPVAGQILTGNYDPLQYTPSLIINATDSILDGVVNKVSKDTLVKYLVKIDSYHNRNSGSDTISSTHGIGAVRRWIHQKFTEYSVHNENRLVVSYLDFDYAICGNNHHRDVLALLPGLDTTQKDIVVIEGHFDTRCLGVCDTACYSPGMEDNGSGTVLVMELARILSRYAFDHTILFACVTGEDQGLYGSRALANWLHSNNVRIRSCFNNDVIGGIICGQTSSPPGCPYLNHIDSTHVRIFSYSPWSDTAINSPHKQLARYIRLHQEERINPLLSTPMNINIIVYEDRINRSGDQIPFRQDGYTAIRFCSQNEHGNGQGIPPDRQHTSNDILGLDLTVPPDGVVDSFFVDPNYLRRNVIMNGVNLGWLALAPPMPDPEFVPVAGGIEIILHGQDSVYRHYRVGVRTRHSGSLYFDTVYTFINTNHLTITGIDPNTGYMFSVASVRNNIESLFSDEFSILAVGMNDQVREDWGIIVRQNHPNPFSDITVIGIEAAAGSSVSEGTLLIRDITGRIITTIPVTIRPGLNEVTFRNTEHRKGLYLYSLRVEGKILCTNKMTLY